jgi:hypothetical protein
MMKDIPDASAYTAWLERVMRRGMTEARQLELCRAVLAEFVDAVETGGGLVVNDEGFVGLAV